MGLHGIVREINKVCVFKKKRKLLQKHKENTKIREAKGTTGHSLTI
jgi:hypothetical protein